MALMVKYTDNTIPAFGDLSMCEGRTLVGTFYNFVYVRFNSCSVAGDVWLIFSRDWLITVVAEEL